MTGRHVLVPTPKPEFQSTVAAEQVRVLQKQIRDGSVQRGDTITFGPFEPGPEPVSETDLETYWIEADGERLYECIAADGIEVALNLFHRTAQRYPTKTVRLWQGELKLREHDPEPVSVPFPLYQVRAKIGYYEVMQAHEAIARSFQQEDAQRIVDALNAYPGGVMRK